MGLRRLRARLDQLQGNANNTMGLVQDLVADLQDGFGVALHLEPHALKKLYAAFMNEEGADLPITVKIDPAVDAKK